MKLSEIRFNAKNPRKIEAKKLDKLCNSIKDFPQMMELRPIVVDDSGEILGGNMRYKALKKMGYTEIPDEWVKRASELTDEQKRRFVVEDNVGFGDWDWEQLFDEFDAETLDIWGVDAEFDKEASESTRKKEIELKPFKKAHVLISYEIDRHDDVMKAIEALLSDDGIEVEKGANG